MLKNRNKSKKFRGVVATAVVIFASFSMLSPSLVYANGDDGKKEDPALQTTFFKNCAAATDAKGEQQNGIICLLTEAIKILSGLIAILAVIGIVYAGLQYASATDDSSKVQAAKTRIVQIVIGLLLYMFIAAILHFLIPGGVFTTAPANSLIAKTLVMMRG